MEWNQFFLNVFASFAGGVVLLLTVSALSKKAKWIITGLFSRLVGADLDFVYLNKNEAESDIKSELKRSNKVDIFTGRGNELQRDAFAPLFAEKPNGKSMSVRILLPKTEVDDNEYDWTARNSKDMAKFDPAFKGGLLKQQIEATIEYLKEHVSCTEFEVRRFAHPHIGRILITERFVYYTPYRDDVHGRYNKIYKYNNGGEMYDNYLRLFDLLWEASGNECDRKSNIETCTSPPKRSTR